MYQINKHIKKELNNEFDGSERKKTVILDDGNKYLLKLSDPIREKDKSFSYINNAYSEYIGCKIAKLMGLPVQEVILGEYTYVSEKKNIEVTRPACLCRDLRNKDERMIKLEIIGLSSYETSDTLTFDSEYQLFETMKGIDKNELKDFYAKLFVLDAFIGNTDRHNGNISIITNDEYSRIAPIYDCGSSLLPIVSDDELKTIAPSSLYLSVCSVITDGNNRLNYTTFLRDKSNKEVDNALKQLFPKINLKEIHQIYADLEGISEARKQMYHDFLNMRYQKILVPALERIFEIDKVVPVEASSVEIYSFHKKYLDSISEKNTFESTTISFENGELEVIKISNKYAILCDNDECIGLLPIRSNNNEVRKCMSIVADLKTNYNMLKDECEVER